MKHQLAQCQLLIMPPSQEARPQPKFTAAKAAAKRWEPDPPRGIPTAQANLISLAVRRQHLAEMLLVKIACNMYFYLQDPTSEPKQGMFKILVEWG